MKRRLARGRARLRDAPSTGGRRPGMPTRQETAARAAEIGSTPRPSRNGPPPPQTAGARGRKQPERARARAAAESKETTRARYDAAVASYVPSAPVADPDAVIARPLVDGRVEEIAFRRGDDVVARAGTGFASNLRRDAFGNALCA